MLDRLSLWLRRWLWFPPELLVVRYTLGRLAGQLARVRTVAAARLPPWLAALYVLVSAWSTFTAFLIGSEPGLLEVCVGLCLSAFASLSACVDPLNGLLPLRCRCSQRTVARVLATPPSPPREAARVLPPPPTHPTAPRCMLSWGG